MGTSRFRAFKPATTYQRWIFAALVCILAVFAACVGDDPEIVDNLGTGGNGAGGAGSGATAGAGGGAICTTADDCPGDDTSCSSRACEDGLCNIVDAAAGTACTEDGGAVCDGMGSCVECVVDDDCAGTDVCSSNTCVPATCVDNAQNGLETDIDCGGPDCLPCINGLECLDDTDCESNLCDSGGGGMGGGGGTGGSGGMGGAGGGSSTPGICSACTDDNQCDPYACDAGVCLSSCVDDNDCANTSWCDGTTCVPKMPDGDPCSGGNECDSGFCADGVCCDSACVGGCESCDIPAAGTCTTYMSGAPGAPACTPYVCDGNNGSCPASCNVDNDCAANFYCDSNNSCQPVQTNGTTCTLANECQSGNCADGFCCNTGCVNACDACDISGSQGTCVQKLDGTPGDPPCNPYLCNGAVPTCPNFCNITADCINGYYCGGSQCLQLKTNGNTCAIAAECQSGNCVDGYCCDGACGNQCQACNITNSEGTCTAVPSGGTGSPSCTPYVCDGNGTTCPTTCVNNNDCTPGNFCDGNSQCAGAKANGGTCTAPSECQSGNCVDGFCCDTGCVNSCDVCNRSGSEGTCTLLPDSAPGNPGCTPYLCTGASPGCPSNCVTNGDCAGGFYCDSFNLCVVKKNNGSTCATGPECTSGLCVDGYCCDGICNASCDACNQVGNEGLCSLRSAGTNGSPGCTPYLCDGLSNNCPASCTNDIECASGNYCSGVACVAKKSTGTACLAANECLSSNCVDGFCCNTGCGSACDACNLSGSFGTCNLLPGGSSGSPSCMPYLCNGSNATCPGNCSVDANCSAGNYCSGTACVVKKGNGGTCAGGNECVSGFCTDGYCCNSGCGAACDACDVSLNEGSCTFVPVGSSGSPSCMPYVCDGNSQLCPNACLNDTDCSNGNYCDTFNQCVPRKGNGAACLLSSECLSSFCVDGYCCNNSCGADCDACNLSGSLGSCSLALAGSSGSPSCMPYVCDGGGAGCPGTCSSDANCSAGNYCNGSTCVAKKANGGTCSGTAECLSGFCVDGYCCNAGCGAACNVCDQSGNQGTCMLVSAGSTGSPSCSPYVCNGVGSLCPTSCVNNTDCTSGNFCDGMNKCAGAKGNGGTCTSGLECQSGICADGFCCDATCGSDCDACDLLNNEGACTLMSNGSSGNPSCAPYVCTGSSQSCPSSCANDNDCASGNYCSGSTCVAQKSNGGTCTLANECISGNCVDGYCCDGSCGSACDACDLSGNLGSCTLRSNGSNGSPSCLPYVCDGLGATCPGSCSNDSQCNSSYYCSGSTCVLKSGNGSTCSVANECQSGFCADGYCCNAACGSACDACDLSGNLGNCSLASGGSTGSPSCAPYVCSGVSASCPNSCLSSTDCASGFFCDGFNQCVLKQSDGSTCNNSGECTSGFCVDGYCCNSGCTDGCNACNLSGSLGTCSVSPMGNSGNPSCMPYVCDGMLQTCPSGCSSDTDCSTGNYCNGTSCVPKQSNGATCIGANECSSSNCVDGYCCNGACGSACDACNLSGNEGLCSLMSAGTPGSPSCMPYVCDGLGAGCPVNCSNDSQCTSGNFCASGACVPKKANGSGCTGANECTGGICADGFCCNTACGGDCDACNLSGSLGTCTVSPIGDTGSPSCSPYVCDGMLTSCPNGCVNNSDCASGFVCDINNLCVLGGGCGPGTADCDMNSGNGCECNTTICCGSNCESQHQNGLGQTFIDCVALGTHDVTQANKAANAWPGGGTVFSAQCSQGAPSNFEKVVCHQTSTECACWAYESSGAYSGAGYVRHHTANNSCFCPVDPTCGGDGCFLWD